MVFIEGASFASTAPPTPSARLSSFTIALASVPKTGPASVAVFPLRPALVARTRVAHPLRDVAIESSSPPRVVGVARVVGVSVSASLDARRSVPRSAANFATSPTASAAPDRPDDDAALSASSLAPPRLDLDRADARVALETPPRARGRPRARPTPPTSTPRASRAARRVVGVGIIVGVGVVPDRPRPAPVVARVTTTRRSVSRHSHPMAPPHDARARVMAPSSASAVPERVRDTASSIAALRALEHARGANGLIRDPFAEALAGTDAMTRVRERRSRAPGDGDVHPSTSTAARTGARSRARGGRGDDGRVAIRTKFFDDAAVEYLATIDRARGGETARQVVLLGAGYDTRAWRLEAPSAEARTNTTVFEVDVASVLERKREIMGDAELTLCDRRVAVHCDMERTDWTEALRGSGFREGLPTVWILEGLMYYLSPRVARSMLRRCFDMGGHSSALVVSVVNPAALARARGSDPLRAKLARCFGRGEQKSARAMWMSACDAPPAEYFAPWTLDLAAQLGEAGCDFGRWTGSKPSPVPTDARSFRADVVPRTFYVRASKPASA